MIKRRTYDESLKTEEPMSPAKVEATDPAPKTGKIVNASLVNMRSIPSIQGKKVAILANGENVEILKRIEKDKYYKVRSGDRVGYIPFDFCEVNDG